MDPVHVVQKYVSNVKLICLSSFSLRSSTEQWLSKVATVSSPVAVPAQVEHPALSGAGRCRVTQQRDQLTGLNFTKMISCQSKESYKVFSTFSVFELVQSHFKAQFLQSQVQLEITPVSLRQSVFLCYIFAQNLCPAFDV